ncbi:MAG: hypothetical protein WCX29_02100 [Candidatus Peribacteraceae bacterium]
MVMSSAIVALFLSDFLLLQQRFSVPPIQELTGQEAGVLQATVQYADIKTVVRGSTRIPVMELALTAGCTAPVRVHSIGLRRVGLGYNSDIAAMYIERGTQRVSGARGIDNRDGSVVLHVRDVVVPACGTETLTILADFAEDAAVSGQHRFVLHDQDPIQSTADTVHVRTVNEPLPLQTASSSVRGTLTVTPLSLLQRVQYGSAQTVARIRLEATGNDRHIVSAIRFTNQGSAQGNDLQNFSIVTAQDGRISAITPAMDGSSVYMRMSPPLVLEGGANRMLILQADVHVGRSKTLAFTVEESGDVFSRVRRGRD